MNHSSALSPQKQRQINLLLFALTVFCMVFPLVAFYASLTYFNNVNDFPEYFSTGSLLKAGKVWQVYDLASQFQQQQADFPGFRQPGVGFFLAPTALPFAFIISLLDASLAKTAWSVLLLLSIPVICLLLKTWLNLDKKSLLWLIPLVCSNGALFESIKIGQPAPFLLIYCLAGVILLSQKQEYKGSWLLSLLSVKPQFALLLGCWLAGSHNRKAVFAYGSTILLWLVPGLLVAGTGIFFAYADLLSQEAVLPFMQPQLSPTLRGILLALQHTEVEPSWCKLITVSIYLVSLAGVFFIAGKIKAAPAFSLSLILPIMCAFSPHCHLYDLVFLIPSLVYLISGAWSSNLRPLRLSSLAFVLLFSQPLTQSIYYSFVQPGILPNPYFLAVILLALLLWRTGCLTAKNTLS